MKADRRLGRQAPTPALAGLHVALLFEKPSLRTRSTFEIAIRELGGDTLHLPAQFAEGVREPLEDVARNLERWVRALVIRTYEQESRDHRHGRPQLHVINALTDEEHPCQALADVMTLARAVGRLPRSHGRVRRRRQQRRDVAGAGGVDAGRHVHVASPAGYELSDEVISAATRSPATAPKSNASPTREAVAGADAVYTDVWTSMGEEAEADDRRRAFAPYQVDSALMSAAAPDALFMHCLPAHRGEEVTSEVIDSPASVVFDQAENRLHTQKALLQMLIGKYRSTGPGSNRVECRRVKPWLAHYDPDVRPQSHPYPDKTLVDYLTSSRANMALPPRCCSRAHRSRTASSTRRATRVRRRCASRASARATGSRCSCRTAPSSSSPSSEPGRLAPSSSA